MIHENARSGPSTPPRQREERPALALLTAIDRRHVSAAVWLLYGLACLCPAIRDETQNSSFLNIGTMRGFQVLIIGWIPPFCIPWSANIFLLVGWLLLLWKRYSGALLCGIIAVMVGLITWVITAGRWSDMILIGSYLWEASLVVFVLGVLAVRKEAPLTAKAAQTNIHVNGEQSSIPSESN